MGGEQTIGVNLSMQIFTQSPWQTETLIRAGTSTKLIYQNQTFRSSSFKHTCRFDHFTHKCRNTLHLLIRRSHSTNDRVNYRRLKSSSRHKHTNMSKITANTNGSNVGRLTAHIWASQYDSLIILDMNIISNTIFDTRMTHLQTYQSILSKSRFWPSLCRCGNDTWPTDNYIQLWQNWRKSLHYWIVTRHYLEHIVQNLLLFLTILILQSYQRIAQLYHLVCGESDLGLFCANEFVIVRLLYLLNKTLLETLKHVPVGSRLHNIDIPFEILLNLMFLWLYFSLYIIHAFFNSCQSSLSFGSDHELTHPISGHVNTLINHLYQFFNQ